MHLSSRIMTPLAENWHFRTDPDGIGIKKQWYLSKLEDSKRVKVPHTWNVEEGLEEYRGTAWYSYDLEIPADWDGKMLRLQFNAAYRDATVWLNGIQAGQHKHSGYTPFIIDITDLARPGAENLLTVSVNNENSDVALPIKNSFDWTDDGGLIRGVSLIVTGEAAIDYANVNAKPLFKEAGANDNRGILNGQIKLCERGIKADRQAVLKVTVEHEGKPIALEEYSACVSDGKLHINDIMIDQVKLWHFDHPHLYDIKLELMLDDKSSDELTVHIGFREITTDGSKLLLNREPVRLMGVEWMPGSHPDKGMAETEDDLIRSLKQIKHANCVITRFHWQQDSILLDWCDRNGLLVQEEIPHWQQPDEPDETLLPISMQHAEEMVVRHYNHPCIYAWGIGNEVNGQSPKTVAYMKKLKSFVEILDSSRFINYVSNSVHFEPSKDATGAGDLLMWNDYIGTWHGELDETAVISQIRTAYPEKPLVVAEYGLCEPAFEGGDPRRIGILEQKTEEYRKHGGIAALIFFSLNDYRTQMGEEGDGRLRQRVHGTTDLYGVPKPSYWKLRETASPLALQVEWAEQAEALKLTLLVRSDIPSYSVKGYRMTLEQDGTPTDLIRIEIPDLSAGEEWITEIVVSAAAKTKGVKFEIFRPTGFSVMNGCLKQNEINHLREAKHK